MSLQTITMEDLPRLREEAIKAFDFLAKNYPSEDIGQTTNKEDFPLRWFTKQRDTQFEWVISEMGSITLRLGATPDSKKNPPPIYYLSIQKNNLGDLEWANPLREPVHFPSDFVLDEIKKRIQLYIESVA
ncbi:hypothetical protein P3G55_13895 [Leptospira sp. 96542]|nr:hypothetical protein [Leptospira sp. 96542]